MFRAILACAFLLIPALATAAAEDAFLQGPEQVGQVRSVQGTVIGLHADPDRTCAVVLADLPREHGQGMGGGGRFFLCSAQVEFTMGQAWKGQVKQTGTRRARVGSAWRTLPLFVPVS